MLEIIITCLRFATQDTSLSTFKVVHMKYSRPDALRVKLVTSSTTVEALLTHTPRFQAQAMGYKGVWVNREPPKKSSNIFFVDILYLLNHCL